MPMMNSYYLWLKAFAAQVTFAGDPAYSGDIRATSCRMYQVNEEWVSNQPLRPEGVALRQACAAVAGHADDIGASLG